MKTETGDLPLWLALFNKNDEAFDILLNEFHADVNRINRFVFTFKLV